MKMTKKVFKTSHCFCWLFQLSLLLFPIFFAACKNYAAPKDIPPSKESRQQDSLRWQEIRRRYEQTPHELALKDTFYLFEMHGSWGGREYYCAIFPDSLGYHVFAESEIGCGWGTQFCTASKTNKNITPDAWHGIDRNVKQSGFWHTNLHKISSCDCCEYYQLWIKQGKNSKTIKWATTDIVPDSIRILATQLLAWGGLPEYKPIGWYLENKDSTVIRILQLTDTFFVKSRTIERRFSQTGEMPYDYNKGTPVITVETNHENRYPAYIYMNEYWMDGTRTTKMITDYEKVSPQKFSFK